jgi:hypothetical protein
MKRLFKLPKFDKWMKKTGLTDQDLCKATQEIANGLIDADLGKGVVKKRISLPGQGKRGGARTIIATNKKNRWFFLFGFQKNEKDNISENEKAALQRLAVELLNFADFQLDHAVLSKELIEVNTND